MYSIAPSEKDTDNAALEKRLWDIHHLAPQGMIGFVLAVTASLNHSFCISGL